MSDLKKNTSKIFELWG